MTIITLLDKKTNKVFEKVFYDALKKDKFIRKIKYSKTLVILSIREY